MKGVDVPIEKQRLIFDAYLWASNTSDWFGRCSVNYREEGQVPEVLVSGNEYRDVLLDDSKDSVCFFHVLPDRTDRATVDIYFAVNLKKLYPSVTERATEYALSDVTKRILQGGMFKVESISDGYESWRQWSMVKKEDNMQPHYLFRVRTNVEYSLNC